MPTKIKVIGLGGAGCNAVSRMASCRVKGIELIAANTDAQDLKKARVNLKVRLGKALTGGLGTGMNPEIGRDAARESQQELTEILRNTDMLFLTCGLGGGTGTGASGVVADIARSLGILTIAVVTLPFSFEGAERKKIAEQGIADLQNKVDTLLVISNDKIFTVCGKDTSLKEAFWQVDELLRQAVKGISDLIIMPGFINVDFADVKTIMRHGGQAMFGVGVASGEDRAKRAIEMALRSPFLDFSIEGSRGILFNVSGAEDLTLAEVQQAAESLTEKLDPRARVIFGAVRDPRLKKGEMKVTMIATRFRQ
ncbi:MAG: cell division protein FtsZ [Candidatus Wildermuthbacteria bacterium RIFCSPHIGHO2_01_FULL_47_27]|uniref:Cell division protein FtsZ n=2 Tax=Candidatus Wildermuthiibacteriota TaxID=1817923 RepID=A0A1G2RRE1_9BACT|nr:MAG: Cell division protein FtsZ [Parcubacteria group bacterium GW2011_GWA2_47_9]OHA64996.1 MAG: cell division protein FtsZ [Candidatus Wildermuthbacteria bacterium RIFCSPHIGHO2_01_FULL_47_27]OHA66992.1 MAG: cell division protein FtsZ [Candidatus Wildermuthbacteria bacterium RIFCSPHIGHO2_02_FULL_47_17]OHA75382.1 MAG: cell division protein FtsZ [Candidatus Wildermuthbacteria bacterium RIFCSPLOWO2_02_FULL_47_10]OHA75430.1 MAG: cell division protein FtsZ [Candidatus Wildermuthbacteria bacterium 